MFAVLTRHLIGPLHERALGRATFRFLRELERSQWYAPSELRQLQHRKLRALLEHAARHTAFYRRRLTDAGPEIERSDPFAVLERLPCLSRDDIRTSIDEMVWSDVPGGLIRYTTGGSTGEPLVFYFDRRRQAFDQAARVRSHRWFGVEVGAPEVFLWGSPIELSRADTVRSLRDRLFNQHLLDAFRMSPARMDAYLDRLDHIRPVALFGYPSSIALLVEHARQRCRWIDRRRLKAVFVTGEVCYPHQRDAIQTYFRVPVADGYGSRDGGFIAHECPEGRMHITAENVIVEVVDDRGSGVPPGESGEIVITHLDAYAMPLIRYRTGDRGRLAPGRCACGRGLPMMDVIEGRTTDFIRLPDGTVKHALSVIYPLREMKGVRQFRVTQRADLSVVVDVVSTVNRRSVARETIAQRLAPVLEGQVEMTVRLVDSIPLAKSGKYRYVESHVSEGGGIGGGGMPAAVAEGGGHA